MEWLRRENYLQKGKTMYGIRKFNRLFVILEFHLVVTVADTVDIRSFQLILQYSSMSLRLSA